MKDALFALMLALLSDEQKYAIAIQEDLSYTEALDLLGFDAQQAGLPLKEDDEKLKV